MGMAVCNFNIAGLPPYKPSRLFQNRWIMLNSTANLTAKRLDLNFSEVVPIDLIPERVMGGEVIVMPQAMQAIDCFEPLLEASLAGIQQAIGAAKATQIRHHGFEAIHKMINLEELTAIMLRDYELFRALAPAFLRVLVRKLFQIQQSFYFEEVPNVRFHIPYDCAIQKRDEFNRDWSGKITPHCPHHDSWYDCPTNAINLWIAIGRVKTGNGMSLYPQVYGKRLPCTEDGRIPRNQYFGSALNFDLDPGDVVIFHGEHLHSSEINSTDETRHVISFRITLEKPQFLRPSPHRYCYSGFSGQLATAWDRLSNKVLSRLPPLLNIDRSPTPDTAPVFVGDDTSGDFPPLLTDMTVDGIDQKGTKLPFDDNSFPVGTIRPLSTTRCAARLNAERIVVFNRYCPHEGADLAAGYLRNGCVVCPWHNLPFNLENGASPCQSLAPLSVIEYPHPITRNQNSEDISSGLVQF
jgi:nitrite reductase/ring-hydroxylating ferredoxin subunit